MKIFIDSSVLVEYIKGTKTDLLEKLIASDNQLYINAIVFSEFMFYYLAVTGEKSPLAIKESKQIKQLIEKNNPVELFTYFETIPIDETIKLLSYEYMKQYNFLPNDALILATTKLHGVEALATYDMNDFETACQSEGVKLINSENSL